LRTNQQTDTSTDNKGRLKLAARELRLFRHEGSTNCKNERITDVCHRHKAKPIM